MENFGIFLIFILLTASLKTIMIEGEQNNINGSNNNTTENYEEILKTAQLIENGNPPSELKSNKTSHTMNFGSHSNSNLTVTTINYSVGNDTEGAVYTVRTVYHKSVKRGALISISKWNSNGKIETHEFEGK
ncbi:uncharacterized protein LOC122502863 [Leptopilina heterotoma]|uniref:uncharacterized protein LOC122502863 n=1 Tax=Leptopilina heterotoma TaxID=63436 RepID=UPI001CA9C861|nr:uncharacterized protein LOC122502863 [Leptopilina heterotoma]